MALRKCWECKQEFSTTAKTCPHCGAKAKKKGSTLTNLLTILLIIGFFSWWAGQSTKPPSEPEVRWDVYAPNVKARVDSLAAARNCPKLQAEFNTAEKNSGATRHRTGRGNSDLMSYIDFKMKGAGCYQ